MRTKQWIDPISLWQSAQKVGSKMPRPYIFLGDIDRQEGRYEAAIQNYTLALAVQRQALSGGDLFSIYSGIGSANISLGRWSEAEQSYLKALSIDPESESTKLRPYILTMVPPSVGPLLGTMCDIAGDA